MGAEINFSNYNTEYWNIVISTPALELGSLSLYGDPQFHKVNAGTVHQKRPFMQNQFSNNTVCYSLPYNYVVGKTSLNKPRSNIPILHCIY
jgi:hypothetical protein